MPAGEKLGNGGTDGLYSIYLIRLGLATYYDYRTSKLQAHVDDLQKQRDTTIDKLKAATKYNTTQQLLEKYGGNPSKLKAGTSNRKTNPSQGNSTTPKGGRTGFVPPPTANIPGRNGMSSLPNTPLRSTSASSPIGLPPPLTAAAASPPWPQPSSPVDTAEFAPNAFSSVAQYEQVTSGSRWYDRLMDILLGEDETNPKNRLALICMKCRLVNGQAPPGIKQLEDVGRWRCSGCGTMNGVESEGKRIIKEVQQRSASEEEKTSNRQVRGVKLSPDEDDHEAIPSDHGKDNESDITQYSEDETDELVGEDKPLKVSEEPEIAKPKRGRPKGSVKKKA